MTTEANLAIARLIVQEVDRICEAWWLARESFEPKEGAPLKREDRMALAFRSSLGSVLREKFGTEYSVVKEAYPFRGLGRAALSSAFSRYDVGVTQGVRFAALLELSVDDSTVCHALDNGEHKLLAICDGIGCASDMPFWQTRGFSPQDVVFALEGLESVPVRGLFFISRVQNQGLDVPQRTIWTDGGSRPFRSALIPKELTTLREAFACLREAGLFIWHYSLANGELLKLRPAWFEAELVGPHSTSCKT